MKIFESLWITAALIVVAIWGLFMVVWFACTFVCQK